MILRSVHPQIIVYWLFPDKHKTEANEHEHSLILIEHSFAYFNPMNCSNGQENLFEGIRLTEGGGVRWTNKI